MSGGGTLTRRELLRTAAGVGLGVGFGALHPMNAQSAEEATCRIEPLGYVVVSPDGPDDGGHFGPKTPDSKTSGIQEAIEFAKSRRKDVYLIGGSMPEAFETGVVYHLFETLRIPWMQDFQLDGGEYNLVYTPETGDAIEIDSQMNCRYKFGKLIAAQTDGAVLAIRPTTCGLDNRCVVNASVFDLNVVGAGGAWPGEGYRAKGTGILLDASHGPIVGNRVFAAEAVGCTIGIHLRGREVQRNEIQSIMPHPCQTHLRAGDPGESPSRNRITLDSVMSHGIEGSVGADIYGRRNLMTLNISETAKGKSLIWQADAADNLIFALALTSGITNLATSPTNRVIPCSPVGMSIDTPAVPASGEKIVNAHPYPVEAPITSGGTVTDWALTDPEGRTQTVQGGLRAGQRFMLEPADSIAMSYADAPSWRWRARA